MTKVRPISGVTLWLFAAPGKISKPCAKGLTTSDYRRILSELRLRPPTQRAFLRRLLTRAIAGSATNDLPVTIPVVHDPVGPA
jgi:hypothetical protein